MSSAVSAAIPMTAAGRGDWRSRRTGARTGCWTGIGGTTAGEDGSDIGCGAKLGSRLRLIAERAQIAGVTGPAAGVAAVRIVLLRQFLAPYIGQNLHPARFDLVHRRWRAAVCVGQRIDRGGQQRL